MSETFGDMLRQFRLRFLVTQRGTRNYPRPTPISRGALGRQAGTHGTYIKALECGDRVAPTRPVVLALAHALNLSQRETDRLLFAAGLAPQRDYQALYERSEERFVIVGRRERAS